MQANEKKTKNDINLDKLNFNIKNNFLEKSRNLVSFNPFNNENNFIMSNLTKFKSSENNINSHIKTNTDTQNKGNIHSYFNNVKNAFNTNSNINLTDNKLQSENSINSSCRNIMSSTNTIFPLDNTEDISNQAMNIIINAKSFNLMKTDSGRNNKVSKKINYQQKINNFDDDVESDAKDKTNGFEFIQKQRNNSVLSLAEKRLGKVVDNMDCLKLVDQKDIDGEYTQLNQYKLKDEIGKGSYGIVKLAHNKLDNKNYAMKMISKKKLIQKSSLLMRPPSRRKSHDSHSNNTKPFDRIYKEIAILKKLSHPNVVKLIEVLDDPSADYFCLVFEYIKKGTLIDIPTECPLHEDCAWKYFRGLLKGIEYLHFNKIIHRDIKPSNLLLSDDNEIKIVDFGISNEFDGDDAVISNSLGTPAFLPPEALSNSNSCWLGRPLDIWAIGITLYSFVYGECPFNDDCPISLRIKIQHTEISFPEHPKTSESLKDLISKLLTKNPTDRITMAQIKKHEWLTRQNECPLITNSEEIKPITVTADEVKNSITMLYKLDTLILIKAMIKNRSFGHPFRSSLSNSSI